MDSGDSCQIYDTFDPCSDGNHKPFPYMSDRCPECDYLSNDRSDLYDLDHDTWYGTEFNMTTRYVSPYGCGTRVPIWMNGTIPMIGEGVVSRTACVATFESLCALSYSIKVKRCDSSKTVYCLDNLPSSIQQRYCFDLDRYSSTPTTSSKAPSTIKSVTRLLPTLPTSSTTQTMKPSSRLPLTTEAIGETRMSTYGALYRSSSTPTSSTTQTTNPSSRLQLPTEAIRETRMSTDGGNGMPIWVIAVIAGLTVAIITLVAVIIVMKRRFSMRKDDNEYDVPEKKYVSDTQPNDYMTLDLPPLVSKVVNCAIPDQNEARYVSINDICT
ncbi:hypothetical protein CHS0354_002917 [Potamilus streckersoni]|uniref:UMOD/GP2/OIT3-like D8C domain-containing protein n=1 Tax=Potamilus streckersoni TaxID=2493646 RepID=A0AAE0WBB7_9BIVA|nr:hypothetical protein CHS0354_002917 [Potamilus streckersoni]